jgi:hypothetical protein
MTRGAAAGVRVYEGSNIVMKRGTGPESPAPAATEKLAGRAMGLGGLGFEAMENAVSFILFSMPGVGVGVGGGDLDAGRVGGWGRVLSKY